MSQLINLLYSRTPLNSVTEYRYQEWLGLNCKGRAFPKAVSDLPSRTPSEGPIIELLPNAVYRMSLSNLQSSSKEPFIFHDNLPS